MWLKITTVYLDHSSVGWLGSFGSGQLGWALPGSRASVDSWRVGWQLVIEDGLTHMSGGKQAVSKSYEETGPHAAHQAAGQHGFVSVTADLKSSKTGSCKAPLRPTLETCTLLLPKHSIDRSKTQGQLE